MRKAFTLIEVLVASALIAVVALALLQTHSNNTKLIANMHSKYQTKELFTLVLLNADANWDGSKKTLYDMISTKFKINDDETRKWLKDKSINYSQDELSSIDLLDTDLSEFVSNMDGIDKSSLPDITLLVDKVSMDSEDGGASGYTVSLQ